MNTQKATFGGGCFWCTEAIFKRLKGVTSVMPGYAGGKPEKPTYEQVCSGTTGHAEVIQIEFDRSIIPYETLVEVFFGTHNPTTINQQGNDVGEQYRSIIFYHDDAQKKVAEEVTSRLEKEKTFDNPIITKIVPLKTFFEAEDYHRDYFAKNPENPYCQAVISPKLTKLREKYKQYLQ